MQTTAVLSLCLGAVAGLQEEPTRIIATGGQAVTSAAWSPDGVSFAAAAFKRVAVWDAGTLESLLNATDDTDIIRAVAYSPDASMLVSSGGRTLHGWDAHSGEEVQRFQGHTDYTYALAFSGDGRLISAGDKTARVWNLTNGKELFNTNNCPSLCVFRPSIYSVDFNADSSLFASGAADGSVMIRNAADGTLKHKLFDHTEMVMSLAFSPKDTALASAAFDGTVRVVDSSSGETLQVLQVGGTLWSLAYSPDGKRLAAGGSDGIVRIWDTGSWSIESSLEGHFGEVKSVTFSSSGDRLLVSQGNAVFLWNMNSTDVALV